MMCGALHAAEKCAECGRLYVQRRALVEMKVKAVAVTHTVVVPARAIKFATFSTNLDSCQHFA
jgi:uncharacterized OB-fold protein